jgi:hypothetical protein
MYIPHPTAARLPAPADRSQVPEDEREDYERVLNRVAMCSEGNPTADARPLVDGRPYAKDFYSVWTHAPRLLALLLEASRALMKHEGQPDHFSHEDHEMIDLVLGFDSGYWAFHAGHTASAISSGIRIEAIEAMAEGREDELTEDERFQVEFIRAVLDGRMTDDLWARALERQGSVRGVVEFAFFACRQFMMHRMMWAFGCAAIDRDEWFELLRGYREGTIDVDAATGYYLRPGYVPGERVD